MVLTHLSQLFYPVNYTTRPPPPSPFVVAVNTLSILIRTVKTDVFTELATPNSFVRSNSTFTFTASNSSYFCCSMFYFSCLFIFISSLPSNTDKAGVQSRSHLWHEALALLRQAERVVKAKHQQPSRGVPTLEDDSTSINANSLRLSLFYTVSPARCVRACISKFNVVT